MARERRSLNATQVWTLRLERDGRVDLPPVAWRLAGAAGLILLLAAGGVLITLTGVIWVMVFGALLAAGCLLVDTMTLLRARRGELTVRVDWDGIAVGTRRLAWDEVTSVRSGRSGRSGVVTLTVTAVAGQRIGVKRAVALPTVNGFRSQPMAQWLEKVRAAHGDRPTPTD